MTTILSSILMALASLPSGVYELLFFSYWMIPAWLLAVALFGDWRHS